MYNHRSLTILSKQNDAQLTSSRNWLHFIFSLKLFVESSLTFSAYFVAHDMFITDISLNIYNKIFEEWLN